MSGFSVETFLGLSGMQRGALTSLGTIIYTAFTLWIILETRKSTNQSRRFFELSQQPNIDIYIERDESWQSLINIIIKNTGYGGAYDIKLHTDKDFYLFDKKDDYTLKNIGYFKNGISYLPPNGIRQSRFTVMSTNYEEKIKWEIDISVSYLDKYGKQYQGKFLINLNQFENTTYSGEPPLYKISKSITSIEKHISHFATGLKKLQVITQTKNQMKLETKKQNADALEQVKKMRDAKKSKQKTPRNDIAIA